MANKIGTYVVWAKKQMASEEIFDDVIYLAFISLKQYTIVKT